MKKILLAILLLSGVGLKAQVNLDTVYIRNLTLQAQDWLWLTGKYTTRVDSLTLKGFRKIRARAQEVAPIALTANVNIDSVPGVVIVHFYRIVKNAAAGEIAVRYTAITSAIAAKTVLASFIADIDASSLAEFVRARELGKYDVIDQ
jgi:hypothetical protein